MDVYYLKYVYILLNLCFCSTENLKSTFGLVYSLNFCVLLYG